MENNKSEKNLTGVTKKISNAARLKHLKQQTILEFLTKYNKSTDFELDSKSKIKLCSSDSFANAVNDLANEYKGEEYPVIIGHVSGFYETATLAGLLSKTCKNNTKPFLLFFDRNTNNIQNAIFNSLLISICDSKEDLLMTMFSLNNMDIIKAFRSKYYNRLVAKAMSENAELLSDTPTEKEIDKLIESKYVTNEDVKTTLSENFSVNKLRDYVLEKKFVSAKSFDISAYHERLIKKAKGSLNKEMLALFDHLSNNFCTFLGKSNNFIDFANYLFDDLKRNKGVHILDNNIAYNGYKSLIAKNGSGNVKFLPGVDITKPNGIEELKNVLTTENIIFDYTNKNKFPVDIAVIPHVRRFRDAYPFLKTTSQFFVEANKDHRKSPTGIWSFQPTTTLYAPSRENIGAKFIEEELVNRPKFSNIIPIEKLDGFPTIVTFAGINYGNIYTNYADLENIVALAKADKADMALIQGLVYANHFRYQTKKRSLTDPKYPDLDSRLKAARTLVDDLNKAGIKVIYQTGDEDENLREELFYTYFFDELKEKKNFLARKDNDPEHDWIRDVINSDLIPYLIRSGRDITSYYDENGIRKTRIGEVCSYIRAIKDKTPLGRFENMLDENGNKLIDECFFKDTDMFKVVSEIMVDYSKDNSRLSVDMPISQTFSSITQYANPDYGILKRIANYQSGAIKAEEKLPQLVLDSRQAYMSFNVIGGRDAQVAVNTPQLTDDQRYYKKEFLTGVKRIASDPTHKRVTQGQIKLNFPGSWTITGDLDQIMRVYPYWRRSREVMEHVQKTGVPLKKRVELHINDIQLGSITERLPYFIKYLDIGFHLYNADIITYLGDLQQGSNYKRFPIESRHTAAQSVGQQTIDFQKLQRPFIRNAFGVVHPKLFVIYDANENFYVDEDMSLKIIGYLLEKQFIEKRCGEYGYVYAIKQDVKYSEINLQLPEYFQPYEKHIRARLNTVRLVEMIKIAEGNHEKNTDWEHKGYKPLETLKLQLDEFKNFSAADVDIKYAEYILNSEGDYVEGSYCYSEINGYRTLSGHNMRTPSKGSGGSATRNMANYTASLGLEYRNYDIFEQGHLHNLEASIINDKLHLVIPGIAGQSGFEQMLGYASHPRGLIKIYWPDGRFSFDIISSNVFDRWEIMNPEIREKGIERFIKENMIQEVPIISESMPAQIHQPIQRELRPATLTKRIGPYIPR